MRLAASLSNQKTRRSHRWSLVPTFQLSLCVLAYPQAAPLKLSRYFKLTTNCLGHTIFVTDVPNHLLSPRKGAIYMILRKLFLAFVVVAVFSTIGSAQATQTICSNQTNPAGWVTIHISTTTAPPCPLVPNNLKTIEQIDTIQVSQFSLGACNDGAALPTGWVVTAFGTNAADCGGGQSDVKTLFNTNGMALGNQVVVCFPSSPIPPGWTPLGTGTNGQCSPTTFPDVQTIRRDSGPDLTLSITPASQTVVQGSSTTYQVSINRVGGFTAAVTLSLSAPAGITGSFSPNNTTANSSTLTLTAAGPTGIFGFNVNGVSGAYSRSVHASVTVNPAPTPTPTPVSPLTSFVLPDTSSHTVFINANSHLIDLFLNSSGVWQKQDLMTAPGAVLAFSAGKLASIVNAGGCPHVFYVTQDAHLGSVYLANITGGCASTWSYQDLTAAAGATNSVAGNSSIATVGASNDALQEQFYIGSNFHLYRLYWPSSGGVFNQDLTAASGANSVNTGSGLAAIVNTGNCPHVFYVDTNQHVSDIYQGNITGGCTTGWNVEDLTSISGAGNLARSNSPISTLGVSNDALQHQYYVGSDNHLYRFYWPSSGGVINQDLTLATGGPQVGTGSGLASIVNAGGCPHAFYIDVNQHVSSAYLGNITGGCAAAWSYQDLTSASGAANVGAIGSPLTVLGPTIDVLQSQFYIGTNNDVYRLGWPSSGGVVNLDITAAAH